MHCSDSEAVGQKQRFMTNTACHLHATGVTGLQVLQTAMAAADTASAEQRPLRWTLALHMLLLDFAAAGMPLQVSAEHLRVQGELTKFTIDVLCLYSLLACRRN